MHDLALFARLVRANYAVTPHEIQRISGSQAEQRAVYRIIQRDGSAWLVRAYRQDAAMPDWLMGCAVADTDTWLRTRAATLLALAQHDFPAPRVMLTNQHDLIGEAEQWCTLITSYIPGQTVEASPEALTAMGAALAQLHRLPLHRHATAVPIGLSWLEPDTTVTGALSQYAQAAPEAPEIWQQTIAAFCATLRSIGAHSGLARTIIHADCHVQNVVRTPGGAYHLIDWDGAGYGRAVLDLGRLLLYGQFDSTTLGMTLDQAEQWRVDAILAGYCQHRALPAEERAVLVDAIRFSIAFGAASHVARAARAGWRNEQPDALVRRKQWYAVSAEIARFAHTKLQAIDAAAS
jgi:Ser/Thr protein kinase RdoA (MazF antagonist)